MFIVLITQIVLRGNWTFVVVAGNSNMEWKETGNTQSGRMQEGMENKLRNQVEARRARRDRTMKVCREK